MVVGYYIKRNAWISKGWGCKINYISNALSPLGETGENERIWANMGEYGRIWANMGEKFFGMPKNFSPIFAHIRPEVIEQNSS